MSLGHSEKLCENCFLSKMAKPSGNGARSCERRREGVEFTAKTAGYRSQQKIKRNGKQSDMGREA